MHTSVKVLGYATIDAYFRDDLEWFLLKWLATKQPFEAIPLLACSGNARLLLADITAALPPLLPPPEDDDESVTNAPPFTPYFDCEQMHIDLVYNFLENTAQGMLIPCIIRIMKRTEVPREGETAMETEIQVSHR